MFDVVHHLELPQKAACDGRAFGPRVGDTSPASPSLPLSLSLSAFFSCFLTIAYQSEPCLSIQQGRLTGGINMIYKSGKKMAYLSSPSFSLSLTREMEEKKKAVTEGGGQEESRY